MVLTHATGKVELEVPRDRDGTFEPVIVKKRQRRLTEVDELVLSFYSRGLTTGKISAHVEQICGSSVSKETVSPITDKVIEKMRAWSTRPPNEVYAAIFIDAIMVKVGDGQVANRPVYPAIGFSLTGEKDVLGLWAGTGGEGATYWMGVLTYLRNRDVKDAFFVVCDGLKGLPEVIGNVWPTTTVQTRIIHLVGNTFRLASRKDWDAIKGDVKPIYTAVNAAAARAALDELDDKWGAKYRAIIRLWDNAWEEFVPFLDYGACCEMGCRGGAKGLGFGRMVRGPLLPARLARSGVPAPTGHAGLAAGGPRGVVPARHVGRGGYQRLRPVSPTRWGGRPRV